MILAWIIGRLTEPGDTIPQIRDTIGDYPPMVSLCEYSIWRQDDTRLHCSSKLTRDAASQVKRKKICWTIFHGGNSENYRNPSCREHWEGQRWKALLLGSFFSTRKKFRDRILQMGQTPLDCIWTDLDKKHRYQISDDRLDWRELFLKANDSLTTFIFIYFFFFSRLSVRCNLFFEFSSKPALPYYDMWVLHKENQWHHLSRH